MRHERNRFRDKFNAIHEELEEVKRELKQCRASLDDTSDKLDEMRRERDKYRKSLDEINNELEEVRRERDQSIKSNRANYPTLVRKDEEEIYSQRNRSPHSSIIALRRESDSLDEVPKKDSR